MEKILIVCYQFSNGQGQKGFTITDNECNGDKLTLEAFIKIQETLQEEEFKIKNGILGNPLIYSYFIF